MPNPGVVWERAGDSKKLRGVNISFLLFVDGSNLIFAAFSQKSKFRIKMIPKIPDKIHLTSRDRQFIAWTNKPERRHEHIPKYSTLPRVDKRLFKCQSCQKTFTNTELLKRHAQTTHTGTKPIVCEICNRRFSTERHMLSHYNIHNEPRLEEFNVLLKRSKRVRSLPTSFTTVGSYAGVPKGLKSYMSEPTFKSFGTKQTFNVSEQNTKHSDTNFNTYKYKDNKNNDETVKQFMVGENIKNAETTKHTSNQTKSGRRVEFSATTRKYSDISDTSDVIRKVHEAQLSNRPNNQPISRRLSPLRDDGRVQSQTHRKNSNYTHKTRSSILRKSATQSDKTPSSVENSRTPTPKTFHTGTSFSEAHRQMFPDSSAHFWDAPGYSQTSSVRRMSGVTSISGYDPFIAREKSPRKSALKSVKSESFSDLI